jgi:hypothetical protein
MGIEPTTYSLGSCRSTTELRPRTLVAFGAWTPVPYPDAYMVIGRRLAPQVEIQPTAPHYVTARRR